MNINFKNFGLLFLIAFVISSCKTKKVVSDATPISAPLEDALLWEISGNGLEENSFLYGTIHIIDAEDFFWPKKTLSSIEEAQKIVFEIDMKDMNDMGAMMEILPKAMMKGDKSLEDLLSKENYGVVEAFFEEMGVPMFMFKKMKPMFLSVMVDSDMDMSGGFDGGGMKSYEMEIFNIADNAGKTTGGLETIEQQLNFFDSIPYSDQANMLVDAIKNKDGNETNDQMEAMTNMYKSQNISAIVSMIETEDNEISGYEEMFLDNRNKNWISKMDNYMRSERTFFAVGAGHLAGKNGVIQLLRKAGFTLKPLSQETE